MNERNANMNQLEHLDEIAREAWAGNYTRTGVLSTGERLYVALASGRMRELASGDSIAYAVDRVGPEWMEHMLRVWRGSQQPTSDGNDAMSEAHPAPSRELLNDALLAIEALREYIAAIPDAVVAGLPTMPGVDGDWVDDVQGRLADAVRASTKVQSLK